MVCLLVRDVHFEGHRAMPASAKNRTVTDEIPSLIRSELHFSCAALPYFYVYIQFANMNPVRNVQAFEHEHHRLSPLQSNLPGLKIEPLCGDFDPLRCTLGSDHRR